MNIKKFAAAAILSVVLGRPLWAGLFSNVSVRTDSQPVGSSGTTVTISPDFDGTDDGVLISATPPAGSYYWEALISTDSSFSSVNRYLCGNCAGGAEVSWDGRDHQGRPMPNGLYYVKLNGPTITPDTSLTVTVQTAFIGGTVSQAESPFGPLQDVNINVWSSAGGGYARTDLQGFFFVGGLKAGNTYTVNISRTGRIAKQFSAVAAINFSTTNVSLAQGVPVQVHAERQLGGSGNDPEIWGSLNIHNSSFTENAYGSVHFPFAASGSDNGYFSGDVAYSTWTTVFLSTGTTYTVNVYVPQYGNYNQSLTTSLTPGATTQIVFSSSTIVKKSNVYGGVSLSTPDPVQGKWVSVDGTLAGNVSPTAFGGGYIPPATTSATYQLLGLSTGTWNLKARTQGDVTQSASVTISDGNDVLGLNFPVFSAGGGFGGTITVSGDSLGLDVTTGNQTPDGFFQLYVNAHSFSNFEHGHKEASLSTNAASSSQTYSVNGLSDGTYDVFTFLPGFQTIPPGPKQVVVSGGVGHLDLNFQSFSGALNLTITGVSFGSTSVDYALQGNGPDLPSPEGTITSSPWNIPKLGTGLYSLTLKNNSSGLVKKLAFAVTNGQTSSLSVDMGDATYTISGAISIQNPIDLSSPPWNVPTPITAVSGLQAVVSSAPLVQAFSFPLPEHFNGAVQPVSQTTAVPSGSTASYTLTGLVPGTYLIRVAEDLDPSSPPCSGCGAPPGQSEFATSERIISIQSASVAAVDLVLDNGTSLSGFISRPQGDPSVDSRDLEINLRREDNLVIFGASATLTGANSVSYGFNHISAGKYLLEVRDKTFPPKYAAAPIRITVGTSDLPQDVNLSLAGTIVGLLRDADSNTLINSINQSQFLAMNFGIIAKANPWVPGGYAQAEFNQTGPGLYFSTTTGQFAVFRLIPGSSYDISFKGFQGFNSQAGAAGAKAYAPVVISGILVAEGQTVDLGTVDLSQGISLSGLITDSAGVPLPNIPVIAFPSQVNGNDRRDFTVQSYTDSIGKFVLQGVDRDRRFYDIVAAPRFDGDDIFSSLGGQKYGEEILKNVDLLDPSQWTGNNFKLTKADGVLIGSIQTVDGGSLQDPFSERGVSLAPRRGRIAMHRDGAIASDPLGEIDAPTDALGNFRITGLKPGSYTLRAMSIGYRTDLRTLVISAGTNNAGTITLQLGGGLSGTITKPDGSNPNTSEVKFVVGVDAAFQEFIFAGVESNSDTNSVTGYSLTGFKPGLNYSILAGSEGDEITQLATDVSFSSTTEQKTMNLVFRRSPPAVYVKQSRRGNAFTLEFFSTQKLRNVSSSDNDMTQIVVSDPGNAGSVDYAQSGISSSRDTLTVVYNAAAGETSFKLNLAFTTIVVDPDSAAGAKFDFSKTFTFYTGVGQSRIVEIPNAVGGDCTLDGNPSGTAFDPGAFQVDSSSQVEVGVQNAATLSDLGINAPAIGPKARAQAAVRAARALGVAAYPSLELFKAVQMAPAVSPFSSFYDIFLPAGVSHSLKKDALLTLSYDSSITDPSNLNVYYYDPNNGVFLLENKQREVDTVNKTITVAVNHMSTFVVLGSNAPIVGTNDYAGEEIVLSNFPNPFNLKSKSVTLNNTTPPAAQTIEGTMIKYALPPGKSGTAKFEIHNAIGEIVRTITQDAPAGGTYYYTEWDGRNDGGQKAASGVYIVRFSLNGGEEKFFKMAVVK